MLLNEDLNINQFLQLTASGLQVASFTQIRSAIINRYKDVYGSDIDLSTGSADGIFVNDLSLIINNILQTVQTIYANLDVNYATGTYLDALCNLANVTRKDATYSNTSLTLENTGTDPLTSINPIFVDRSGLEWQASEPFTIAAGGSINVQVFCKTPGQISAPSGWIYQTLENITLSVAQADPANLGTERESDASLRNRRSQSSGANGVTVLESLTGALYNLSDVRDVKIYNNNTNASITAKDTTTIDANSIYAIVRYNEGINIDDSVIGSIIHEKLTPGIHSCDYTEANPPVDGYAKSYQYMTSIYGITIEESEQNVYWKKAKSIAPWIKVRLNLVDLPYNTQLWLEEIFNKMQAYLTGLPIGTNLKDIDIMSQMIMLAPLEKGKPRYSVVSASISNDDGTTWTTSFTNPDTYYSYSSFDINIVGNIQDKVVDFVMS